MRILDSTFAASIVILYGVENMNITTIRYQIQRKTDGLKPKVILNPTSNGVGVEERRTCSGGRLDPMNTSLFPPFLNAINVGS